MNRKMVIGILAILIAGLMAVPSMAGSKWYNGNKNSNQEREREEGEKGPSQLAGKSNIGHLYLYEKDSSVTNEAGDWSIVEGGMWGKMKYNQSGPTFDFVFNGHNLPIGQEYTLIYYPDPWPAEGLICLGSGTVTICEEACICYESGGGNIHIKGSVDTGDLPNTDIDDNEGAKIFLVPTAHIDSSIIDGETIYKMIGWDEGANLYEGALIYFDDTDAD
jgi:hypothetical protein